MVSDRGIVLIHDGEKYTSGIYTHWLGHKIPELLKKAAPIMRKGHAEYALARICGIFHENSTGPLSLAIDPPPTDSLEKYSPGDAGIAIVDINTGQVTFHHGYLAREQESFVLDLFVG